MIKTLITLISLVILTIGCTEKKQETFFNPLLNSGADPFAFYHTDGYYYYTHTLGDKLGLWRTKDITDLKNAEHQIVFTPPESGPYSHSLWAPEVVNFEGNWYFYVAADDGQHKNHRMYVLENTSEDPFQGEWVMKGKVASPDDNWAIDGNVFNHNGQYYMIWSGWEVTPWVEFEIQRIYIAKMSNPWTISSERVEISSPQYEWERQWQNNDPNKRQIWVNEGPQYLAHKDKVFIIHSASGCWTPSYSLGLLEADADADLLDPALWKKHDKPYFKQSEKNGVFATGHNSFFKSPDGKEDWILYHANDEAGQGCGETRKPRAQKIEWTDKGYPNFGEALSTSTSIIKPSGTKY
jgi:GH43 family beta-xylosidase